MIKICSDIFLVCLAISFFNLISMYFKSINCYSNSFAANIAFFNVLFSMVIVPYYAEKIISTYFLYHYLFLLSLMLCAQPE